METSRVAWQSSTSQSALGRRGQSPTTRVQVLDVQPVLEQGRWPIKSVVDELFVVTATVLREGHDPVNADVVLTAPDGREQRNRMQESGHGLGRFEVAVSATETGLWTLRVEGWGDPWQAWSHDAVIKIPAGLDSELMCLEGAILMDRAAASAALDPREVAILTAGARRLRDTAISPAARFATVAPGTKIDVLLTSRPLRSHLSAGHDYPWLVEGRRALYGAWYEIFPRSMGAHLDETTGRWVSGTLATAAAGLGRIADMGFDVVYLTPIHPIGTTNRKGRNNSPVASETDPGSPYGIGAASGGHDAVHPDLGTVHDLRTFVTRARTLGLEVALDIALNASPDHPWVIAHPEYFFTRADGSIACSENPPKKYQDIYPLDFDAAPAALYAELARIVRRWVDCGVRTFRVDNPHTKPIEFWQWLIAEINAENPDVVWLSEAFTRPPMMHALAKVGFQQSYTYFTWRNTAAELADYVRELAYDTSSFLRPNFWPTTHDILTPFLQNSGPPAHVLRAVLAATLSPAYGIYSGYEHCEDVARPGAEEQLDNEKYEYKDRRWDLDGTGTLDRPDLSGLLTRLNDIRRHHPSLHWLRNITFHHSDDPAILVFSKTGGGSGDDSESDPVIVVANMEPSTWRETWIRLDTGVLGSALAGGEGLRVTDLLHDETYDWHANGAFVRLGPDRPVHVLAASPLPNG